MLSFQPKREKREAVIRNALIKQLKDSVQSLIYGPGGEDVPRLSANSPKGRVLGHTDNTNALCYILEAIFIHGLKDSLGERLSSIFLGDLDRMPAPNFWLMIMVISHRDLIEQVSSLSYIMSDVGKSRAWMRLALNQGQLISYLSVLASDTQTLKEYYRPTAFLRDLETCDIMLRVLQPLSGITFNLATNAAVLNTWTQTPLILSGIWVPAKYEQSSAPVLSATDVASTMNNESSEAMAINIPQTPLSDQMFDLIIGVTPETNFIYEGQETAEEKALIKNVTDGTNAEETNSGELNVEKSIDTSLALEDQDTNAKVSSSQNKNLIDIDVKEDNESTKPSDQMLTSTNSLSERESVVRSVSIVSETNEYRNLLSDWESSDVGENLPAFLTGNSLPFHLADSLLQPTTKDIVVPEDEKEFEFLSSNLPADKELASFLPMLTVLMNEKGLDYQNYHCNSQNCSVPIGMIYGKPKLCKYDGKYYCYDCHEGETSIIPARVVHSWDFTPYPVCKENKKWLDTVFMHPLLDLRLINPKLYQYIQELSEIQVLRIQLHFIQAYLFTCSQDRGQELRKLLWPREHLYEHVHLYSLHDLKQVREEKLIPLLKQSVTVGKNHISKCEVCSPRGFICEVCKKNQIIYPFQLTGTFTCGTCSGVYHKECVQRQVDCPRCKRIRLRQREASGSDY